jgi:hypothetical protein
MEELVDSQHEQGSTAKGKQPSKEITHSSSPFKFCSHSEDESINLTSEPSQSTNEKKYSVSVKKRTIKEKDKISESVENSVSESTSKLSKSKGRTSSSKHKKTEQYKKQVIVDQYGVFEYDKDPEGYKKARKRQQNRESALRARDKRVNKIETIEQRLEKIQKKSSNLEQENLVLKAEKRQLQDQVKNLLSIICAFGQNKRVKTTEEDEMEQLKSFGQIISTDAANEMKESEDLLFDNDDNDSVNMSPRGKSPEKTMLKLIRKDKESIFDKDEGGYGDLFQKGMMLSLTIVM